MVALGYHATVLRGQILVNMVSFKIREARPSLSFVKGTLSKISN